MTESISGAQLLVEGPQDVWLTSEPQMSFFRSSYKRHVPFGMSLERVNVNPGGLVRFDTSKGDLLGYVYMTKHDLVTDAHVPTPITFTSMSTRLGEQILDKRDLMYLNTIRRVLETKNESQAKTPPGFQPLDLPFTGAYFPLVAIRHAQLDLVFEGLDGAYTYKVWGEFIHLPYEERSWFEMTPQHMLIQQVRKTVPLNGDLCLSGHDVIPADRDAQLFPDRQVSDCDAADRSVHEHGDWQLLVCRRVQRPRNQGWDSWIRVFA